MPFTQSDWALSFSITSHERSVLPSLTKITSNENHRLEEADELEDIGYYETIDGDGASFVEWGEKFPEALPYGYLEISIRVDDEGNRSVRTHAYGDRARRLLFVWAKDSNILK